MRIKSRKKLLLVFIAIIFIVTAFIISAAIYQKSAKVQKVQDDKTADTIEIRLIDAYSAKPISNAEVTVLSGNGIRCIKAPCDTQSQEWKETTDSKGIVNIPKDIVSTNTNISASGYRSGRNLGTDAEKITQDSWIIELDPDIKTDKLERRIKVIDSAAKKPLADKPLWILNRENCRPPSCKDYGFFGATNSIGNAYYHPSDIKVQGDSFVYIEGYKTGILPTGWVNYRVFLKKE